MMLTEEQIKAAESGMDPTNVDGERGLSAFSRHKWPGAIVPYTLHDSAGIPGVPNFTIENCTKNIYFCIYSMCA